MELTTCWRLSRASDRFDEQIERRRAAWASADADTMDGDVEEVDVDDTVVLEFWFFFLEYQLIF